MLYNMLVDSYRIREATEEDIEFIVGYMCKFDKEDRRRLKDHLWRIKLDNKTKFLRVIVDSTTDKTKVYGYVIFRLSTRKNMPYIYVSEINSLYKTRDIFSPVLHFIKGSVNIQQLLCARMRFLSVDNIQKSALIKHNFQIVETDDDYVVYEYRNYAKTGGK